MGVIIGAGVVPIAMAIMWRKANRWACTFGAIGGTCAAVSPPFLPSPSILSHRVLLTSWTSCTVTLL